MRLRLLRATNLNFDFSDDEKLVRDQAARFLKEKCGLTVARAVLDGKAPYAADVWRGLADMGLTATTIPEAYGGVNAGHLTLCLVAEQLGAYLAPTPFSSSVYQTTEAICLYGSAAQKEQWLPKLASGAVIGTIAVVESLNVLTAESIKAKVAKGRLSGTKLIVPDGGIADIAVVFARSSEGVGAFIVDLKGAGVARRNVETVDPTRNSATVTFDGAPAELLGEVGKGWDILNDVYNRAAVPLAFEQIGGAARALDMAVAYAQERYAFGRPIGTFQALKHMMADMYVALKLAESNCYYAAWALATNAKDLPLAAATARVSATQAYQLCSRDNIQIHGGMGFTWEFDCHLYYRRSNYLALQLGGMTEWENKLIDALPVGSAA